MPERGESGRASAHVELARTAIGAWLREGKKLVGGGGNNELRRKAAAFVCLKKDGALRGCIGTFQPARDTLEEEIIANAISAACRDPRFPPLSEDELEDLDISVDVLGEPEAVSDASELDPRRYGVIVKRGQRVGLLLPDLEGVDTAEEQLEIARGKAGIQPHEPIQLFRFTVERYH